MKSLDSKLKLAVILFSVILIAGCTDTMFSSESYDDEPATESYSYQDEFKPVLRNAQLLEQAYSKAKRVASKGKRKKNKKRKKKRDKSDKSEKSDKSDKSEKDNDSSGSVIVADLFVHVGYNTYQANGITPRILEDYEVTQRILEDYGVTRRVLEDYGITQRVLEDYGITQRVLEDYGITRRVLEDYGITQRLLDDYGLTWEEFAAELAAFDPSIKIRFENEDGASLWIRGEDVESVRAELINDALINFVEPDPEVSVIGDLGSTSSNNRTDGQYLPWGVEKIKGGKYAPGQIKNSHVYLLDSGVVNADLNIVEAKDFTMLFVNRDQMVHEQNDWVNPGYFDPGTSGNAADENGHGSHIAGTLAALDNKTGLLGTVAGLNLHSLKVLTADGRTDITTLVAAINYVIYQKENSHSANDQVLINLSLGMNVGTTEFNVLDEAVQRAINSGIVVVVAAGNSGADVSTFSPAHVPDAITVGAFDHKYNFSGFSNRGAGVDILAPGRDIVSLPMTEFEVQQNIRMIRSGTSMATPHVTAAAALYWAQNPGLSVAGVSAGLIAASGDTVKRTPSGTTNRSVSLEFAK